jgi:hypothetical protein
MKMQDEDAIPQQSESAVPVDNAMRLDADEKKGVLQRGSAESAPAFWPRTKECLSHVHVMGINRVIGGCLSFVADLIVLFDRRCVVVLVIVTGTDVMPLEEEDKVAAKNRQCSGWLAGWLDGVGHGS